MEGGGGGGGSDGEKKKPPESGENKVKRKMKTASQLEILEKTYAAETYPSEALRAELSVKLGLSDRQLQMWFCHRRLKDRKTPPVKRPRKDASPAAVVASSSGVGDEMVVGEVGNEHVSGSGSGSSPFRHVETHQQPHPHPHPHPQQHQRVVPRTGAAIPRIATDMPAMKRYYEPPQAISELRAIAFVEAQLGEPLREDGPILGMEFDPLPPGAFGAPIVTVGQQKPATRHYEPNLYERPDAKPIKGAARALHEYQFLPEQPSVRNDTYERAASSHYFGSPTDVPSGRSALPTGRSFMHGNEQVPSGYGFQGQMPSLSLLPQQGRQGHPLPSTSGEYDIVPRKNSVANIGTDAHFGAHPITGLENPFIPSDRQVTTHEEDISRIERKRKSEEARIAKEVEAHEKRIRKELEKQDILRRKREEQMRKEMERQDRERRKEEERLLREKQREEERYQREQKREMERREKFLQKESIRAEKMRLKEELRREKEAARQKAANDRATARRIAKESMELIEDERLELMELAASSRDLPSILSLDSETLQNLELYRDKLVEFPPKSVHLRRPFAIQPWTDSEENIGNLLMVWRFLINFADVLGLWPFTLDEFVQAFHDYDPRLLGEIHVALLRSIIKDIEDVARTPSSTGLGVNQNTAANPGGGHPQIVEGAYAWGFDIRSWQRHLNPLTWPEILRQFALSAGFGPKLKKRSIEQAYLRDENEGNDGEDIISNLRNGAAAENALAIMQERGFSNPRRSRHRLTPGTVKFAAFHVLSLEGSNGLTILEVAEKIQKSGLRDLTTSKTPEASIAAALSRDSKLFERTAPSTYCVRTPYRKDPVDTEAILSAAREKIQIFKNGYLDGEDAEDVEPDDVERDEDSESDIAEDPEADDLGTELKPNNEALSCEANRYLAKTLPADGKDTYRDEVIETPEVGVKNLGDSSPLMQSEGYKEVKSIAASVDQSIDVAGICNEAATLDQEDTVIDESNSGEPWVQGLMEGEYSDLSVEERLSALVALIGVANEGNSIRIILEERLEAANALKKQMWAEVQLDKRRMKEEYVMKMQYPSYISDKTEPNVQISSVEGRQSPLPTVDDKNGLVSTNPVEQKEHLHNAQNDQNYPIHMPSERNPPIQEASTCTDNLSLLQPGYAAERSRSQLKAYIGHKAEEMYVYRSLPLGQDRRRNRYWQFITSSSRNDPGSGRIFVELRHGCWRLIDSEEGFDALLASLDVRGLRESNLHSMLQKVEVSFKETLRRNLAHTKAGRPVNNIKTEVSGIAYNLDCSAGTDSPSCTVYVSNSDMPEPSSSFSIGLGRNETEKKDALKRYQDFEKWMWEECLNSSVLYAVKYGKKRCRQLLDICDCRDVYYFEDDHCPSCHRTYETSIRDINFSEHVAKCKEKFKGDPCWTLQGLDLSPPLRIGLHKALLALIEVSIPIEALQPAWSEGYRRSWGMKLHTVTSAEELLQILTLLEVGIKKDFLSSNFETTSELLGSCNQIEFAANVSLNSELVSVLPWVPQTSSAVALRLMELDASIYYELHQKKIDSQKDKGAGDFIMPPSKFSLVKNVPEYDLAQAPLETENLLQEPWADHGSLHSSSGRGRGARGRGRGGRTRGGRSQRRAISSRSVNAQRSTTTNSERFGQLLGWKGRSRGRGGRKRGRRTARSRQKPVKRVAEIGSERDQPKEVLFENTVRSSDLQWNREEPTGTPLLGAENASSSERSEYEDYNRQAMAEDEYDDDLMVDDYSSVFNGKSMHLMEGIDYNLDGEEDDDDRVQEEGDDDADADADADADGDGDEDEGDDSEEDGQGDTDVERYINDESDEGEEENRDGGGEQIGNTDEGEGEGTGSTSSEYSD